jgi:uncharacterized SAM-binding protein YcdF (DUF218 family)
LKFERQPEPQTNGVAERMRREIRELALKLWQYHRMNQELERAGAILVLCSYDTSVAERAAQLFLEGFAPLLIFSGGLGAITRNLWSEPEAELFARVAREMGVPDERIIVETRSTNTGENVQFTRKLLAERGVDPESFILVQKPYMERRTYATFKRYWPEKPAVVTSPQFSFEEYLKRHSNRALTQDEVICIMVGDLQRIRLYPERGFQIPQEIPDEVWAAYEKLVAAGYDRHLIR